MHELGIMFNVVRTVEAFARENGVEEIGILVLQVGEHQYTNLLEDTELRIEIIPGNALCRPCNKVFNVLRNKNKCPHCGGEDCEVLSGKEFAIKEILVC